MAIAEYFRDQGKDMLLQGRNEIGPYQSPMEDGMRHFHEFLRREMGPIYAPSRRDASTV